METQVDILKENVNGTRQTIKIQLDNTHQEMVHLRTLGADIIQQESSATVNSFIIIMQNIIIYIVY